MGSAKGMLGAMVMRNGGWGAIRTVDDTVKNRSRDSGVGNWK